MSDTITVAVISGIFGIGGTILGVFFGNRFSKKSSMEAIAASNKNAISILRFQEFNKAAARFRAAFIKEQRLLSIDSLADRVGNTASDIVKAAINRHESAMIRFKPFVSKANVEAYEKAWNDYAGDSRHFEQYSTAVSIKIPTKKTLALSKIKKLLKFAEPKH